ncbi:flagellar hook-basal body complex protein (FliE) [Candidatus Koribacter versatilis Ellin345]|uniref:Flagellar hook-basal body complex protein FliE n=1 Tax=Koribacter versatilis (strain Ellin345) TaxID=204669 RepID=Q1IR45_KORVE|nr:flagellar hook-basal body complex protein FliE [Candidatus Koribacter versatilis]ABF40655.1 flagellar hook-basal body complex protein (FliE) [Candidatus Koribacter versatilis Ellin345]
MLNGIPVGGSAVGQAWSSEAQGKSSGFLDSLKSAISDVEDQHTDAQTKLANLLTGKGEDVHSAAIAIEKASLSFELMMQLRNKAVAAYQEVARMQF